MDKIDAGFREVAGQPHSFPAAIYLFPLVDAAVSKMVLGFWPRWVLPIVSIVVPFFVNQNL